MAATPFWIPKNAAAILNLQQVLLWAACDPCIFRIYQHTNLVQIYQELAKIYPFVHFYNGDRRYLDFPKSAILDPYIADIYQHTKFGAYWSRIGQYVPFCVFSRMAVAAILIFQKLTFWAPDDTCIDRIYKHTKFGRHIELQLSAPHLECLPKFFNLLWIPTRIKSQNSGT